MPLAPDGGSGSVGSNSAVLTHVLLGIAHELDGDEALRSAAIDGMDYLLGRNPMGMSYVSGHGTRSLTNPHHRFWARQKDERYPPPPPGAVAGGPNTGVNDPTAKAAGLAGGPALKSYIDHIESWSTNEVAINWNAPLVWAAAWLDVLVATCERRSNARAFAPDVPAALWAGKLAIVGAARSDSGSRHRYRVSFAHRLIRPSPSRTRRSEAEARRLETTGGRIENRAPPRFLERAPNAFPDRGIIRRAIRKIWLARLRGRGAVAGASISTAISIAYARSKARARERALGGRARTFPSSVVPDDHTRYNTLASIRGLAELYFIVGNPVAAGTVSIQAFNFTDSAWKEATPIRHAQASSR